MRIYSLIFIPLLLWGCEKTYDSVIDVTQNEYQVTSVAGIKDTVDLKVPGDSLMNVRLIFSSGSRFNTAYFDVYASDNSKLNPSPFELFQITDIIYQNEFILMRENPIGNYRVNFFVTGFDGKTNQVAVKSFYFNNGQDNVAPVISNSVVEPDTAVVTDTTIIFTSVEAMDSNSTSDISQVYFTVYRPDNTTNGNKLELFDNGNLLNGDLMAGDGIYSLLIQVNQTNDKGTYRFEFQAKDRSGALSNILNHFVLIQ
jgi:hypothetical protein